jgi:transposase
MDRWHVIKNWREALERVLSRVSPGLSLRQHQLSSTPFPKRQKARTTREQAISDASRELRLASSEQVLEYYRQGQPRAQIAQQAHLARATVYKYLAAESLEDTRSAISIAWDRQTPGSLHGLVSRKRCEEGCQNAQQLSREIPTQGFAGNPRTVLGWLQAQGLFPRRYELRQALDDWDHPMAKEPQSTLISKEEKPVPVPASQELPALFPITMA